MPIVSRAISREDRAAYRGCSNGPNCLPEDWNLLGHDITDGGSGIIEMGAKPAPAVTAECVQAEGVDLNPP
jgi:hypothetical protein